MKRHFFIFCIGILLVSCQSKTKPSLDPNYKYVQLIPDSLKTPEEKELMSKLQRVVVDNMAVKNNEMVFNLSKDEFIAKGIPVEYYELIEKNLVDNNKFIKDNKIQNMDSILKESYKEYK